MTSKYKAIKVNGKKCDEHVVVWESVNGPVPKGCVVHHKNEDKRDNRIENLELMTLADHSRYHHPHGVWDSMDEAAWQRWYQGMASVWENKRIHAPEGMAWCRVCKAFKPIAEFGKNKAKANGLANECLVCRRWTRSKAYRETKVI